MPWWMKYYTRPQEQADGGDGHGHSTGGDGGGDGGGEGAGAGEGSGGEKPPTDGGKPAKSGSGVTDKEASLIKEVMEKKEKLSNTQAALEAANAKLKEFDGIDPIKVKELIQAQQAAEAKKLAEAGEWDKLRAQMAEAHTKEVEAVRSESAAYVKEIESLRAQIAELTVGSSFSGSEFIKGEVIIPPSKVRALYGTHFEVVEGKIVPYDKPAGVEGRTMLVDGRGDPLSFDEALRKIIGADPDAASMIRAKISQGAGSKQSPRTKVADPLSERPRGASAISAGLGGLSK